MLLWAMRSASAHKAAKDAGQVIVELEPPELLPGLGGWYEDFLELSTNRQMGMGLGEIPSLAIDAHVAGWSYDDADCFRACIRKMDAAYLAEVNRKDDADPEIAKSSNPARDAFRGTFRG